MDSPQKIDQLKEEITSIKTDFITRTNLTEKETINPNSLYNNGNLEWHAYLSSTMDPVLNRIKKIARTKSAIIPEIEERITIVKQVLDNSEVVAKVGILSLNKL